MLPAASHRILELEVALESQLLERLAGGLKVTPFGNIASE
jgi:DNA-binding transcriptional LysR family regulator